MNQARRELLEAGYVAINSGDVERVLELVAPDVKLVTSGAFLDEGTVYVGHDGVRRFLSMVNEAFHGLVYEVAELTEIDDQRALALVRAAGRGKGSGVEVEMDVGHLWTLRGGKVVRLEAYADHESARAAAGLEA